MKKFDIITEADARVLTRGETVTLARRGHVTPLAQDTLQERRITVVREDRASGRRRVAGAGGRHPDGGDRAAITPASRCGKALVAFLRGRGLAVNDLGTDGTDPVDYPDIAAPVARPVARGEADAGIVIDGAGIGSAIAANKIAGVRAAMATTETIARYSREHNGANVLTLGRDAGHRRTRPGRSSTTWLATPMREPRYIRRLAKIRDLGDEPEADVTRDELQRLIDVIVAGTERGASAQPHARCACHSVLERLLSRSPARRHRRRRDARRRARRRAARRRRRVDDRSHAAQAGRDAQGNRGALPRGGAVQVRDRVRQPDVGGAGGAAAGAAAASASARSSGFRWARRRPT